MLNSRGARTDLCGTPLLRHRNLLLSPFPMERVKLRLQTISITNNQKRETDLVQSCGAGTQIANQKKLEHKLKIRSQSSV